MASGDPNRRTFDANDNGHKAMSFVSFFTLDMWEQHLIQPGLSRWLGEQ